MFWTNLCVPRVRSKQEEQALQTERKDAQRISTYFNRTAGSMIRFGDTNMETVCQSPRGDETILGGAQKLSAMDSPCSLRVHASLGLKQCSIVPPSAPESVVTGKICSERSVLSCNSKALAKWLWMMVEVGGRWRKIRQMSSNVRTDGWDFFLSDVR